MKCPYCGHLNNKVIDSRLNKDKTITRRRRTCIKCKQRFTTYERIEVMLPMLVKKDGRREAWDRGKIVTGLEKACEKRPVSMADIDRFVDAIEGRLQDFGGKEVPTSKIGEWVMEALPALDEVAYVRFASVYRQFKDVNEFMAELKTLLDARADCGFHPRLQGARAHHLRDDFTVGKGVGLHRQRPEFDLIDGEDHYRGYRQEDGGAAQEGGFHESGCSGSLVAAVYDRR